MIIQSFSKEAFNLNVVIDEIGALVLQSSQQVLKKWVCVDVPQLRVPWLGVVQGSES
jgi:hypothetical protein